MDNKTDLCFEKWDYTKSYSNYYASRNVYVYYNEKCYKPKIVNTEAYHGLGIIPSESPQLWEEVDLTNWKNNSL